LPVGWKHLEGRPAASKGAKMDGLIGMIQRILLLKVLALSTTPH